MTSADQRLKELLEKWRKSLTLHLEYSALDDATYQKMRQWPAHERPSRWIIEMALQRVGVLRQQHAEHLLAQDGEFAAALEQMGFLANLLGSEHLRRFIPLAEPETDAERTATQETSLERTREMPRPALPAKSRSEQPIPARSRSRPAAATPKPLAPRPSRKETKPRVPGAQSHSSQTKMVLDDARRLLEWGRESHELPELISRLHGRPSLADVRRILKEHKGELPGARA